MRPIILGGCFSFAVVATFAAVSTFAADATVVSVSAYKQALFGDQ